MSRETDVSRLRRLLSRPDVRCNPLQALAKRLIWRLRWQLTSRPWLLPLGKDLRIAVLKGGAGALIYYQGFSEPVIADLITRFLEPGMVLLDVGAHIGEYVLLGAQAVGTRGQVHAFEPVAETFRLLEENVKRNGFANVHLRNLALSDIDGERTFEICAESSVSSFSKDPNGSQTRGVVRALQVPTMRLDTYLHECVGTVDLVKVDVEGAELLVFLGAEKLLSLPRDQSPVWVFEYEPQNYADFGYEPGDLFALLYRYGYRVYEYHGKDRVCELGLDATPADTRNLLATKDETKLCSVLDRTAHTRPQG